MFGVGRGDIPAEVYAVVELVARRHGADIVNPTLPGGVSWYWFTAPNRGFPFDRDVARAVREDLAAEGLDIANLAVRHYCAVRDVTPNRCTVVLIGTEEECRAACEDDGDDTWRVMRAAWSLKVGMRAAHDDGFAWEVS